MLVVNWNISGVFKKILIMMRYGIFWRKLVSITFVCGHLSRTHRIDSLQNVYLINSWFKFNSSSFLDTWFKHICVMGKICACFESRLSAENDVYMYIKRTNSDKRVHFFQCLYIIIELQLPFFTSVGELARNKVTFTVQSHSNELYKRNRVLDLIKLPSYSNRHLKL